MPRRIASLTAAWLAAWATSAGAMNITSEECVVQPKSTVELSSAVPGILSTVRVDRSEFVRAGDVIAELDSQVELADVRVAEARVAMEADMRMSRASLAFDERNRDRLTSLSEAQAVATLEHDRAKRDAALSAWKLKRTQEQRDLRRLELERARALMDRKTVRSPVDGYVLRRHKEPGEFVEDQPIVTLAELHPLRVEVILPLAAMGKLKPGAAASVWLETDNDTEHQAVVRVVDNVADAASGTIGVRLELPNPDYALPAGVKCRTIIRPGDSVTTAPSSEDTRADVAGPREADAAEPVLTTASPPAASETSALPVATSPASDEQAAPAGANATTRDVASTSATTSNDTEVESASSTTPNDSEVAATSTATSNHTRSAATIEATSAPEPAPTEAVRTPAPALGIADASVQPSVAKPLTRTTVEAAQALTTSTEPPATGLAPDEYTTEAEARVPAPLSPAPSETTQTVAAAATQQPTPLADTGRQCTPLGPFPSAMRATRTLVAVRATHADARIIERNQPVTRGYVVVTEARPGDGDTQALMARLRAAGITDVAPLNAREGKARAALGWFREAEAADVRAAELGKAGFTVSVRPDVNDTTQWWVDLGTDLARMDGPRDAVCLEDALAASAPAPVQ